MKQVIVTFNFDPETEMVSDVVCSVDGIEKKKKTTKKVKELIAETIESDSLISLESNKLVFNNKAVSDMELAYEDRIVIKWEKDGKRMIPIIGKDIAFGGEGTGNKVTKSNTITYKGKANDILAEVGSEFTIELLREGIWKLVSKTNNLNNSDTLESVLEQAENTQPDLLVNTDETTVIDDLQFQL